MNTSNTFFATCSKGVEDLVERELRECAISDLKRHTGGVEFNADIECAYRACLWSRVASRILLQLKQFEIHSDQDLYDEVSNINWSAHFTEDNTFAIDCFSSHSAVSNSHFATLRVKDAIVDYFRKLTGNRPSIKKDKPDIRLNVYLSDNQCLLYLDLSGEALHKRGYRNLTGSAPIRESLAAAMLYRAKWDIFADEDKVFYDPMCGSGTLLIEAAMIAADMAPGLLRPAFGFQHWKQFQQQKWQVIIDEARRRKKAGLKKLPLINGSDIDSRSLAAAEKNISIAGLTSYITLSNHDVTQAHFFNNDSSDYIKQNGLIVTNPPYGKRLGEKQQLRQLYYRFGKQLKKHFNGWTVAIITSEAELAKSTGLRAFRKNTLFNGAIKSVLYHYNIRTGMITENGDAQTSSKKAVDGSLVSITNNDNNLTSEHVTMFINRLKKNYRHLKKWARKNSVSCYRVYDADIPQYSVAIDIYDKWIHVQEYQAPKSIDANRAFQRLNDVIDVVADVLETTHENVVLKVRKRQEGTAQYQKIDQMKRLTAVRENELKFLINIHDYIDTGLFLDHRLTRQLIKTLARNKRFLNLFAYTGSATIYAAAGGATTTTTVDMSNTYLNWAKQNMSVNGYIGKTISASRHDFIRADCLEWIADAVANKQTYQLIFIDPPTFSNSKKMSTVLDINRDHVALLNGCLALLADDGQIIFSTNARGFRLDETIGDECYVRDITRMTTTEDFKRKPLHHCWCLAKKESALSLPHII